MGLAFTPGAVRSPSSAAFYKTIPPAAWVGAILSDNYGKVTVDHSNLDGNVAFTMAVVSSAAARLTITNSKIGGNRAEDKGGGIYNAGTLTSGAVRFG
jgi:hypothetical protein